MRVRFVLVESVVLLLLTLVVKSSICNGGNNKKLSRNYASYECGAKVIASNQEAEGASRILSESKDEYMLNPCKAKIWFVVELCEPIQPSSIELANFELFSSTPKELVIHGSDRYPTRDWVGLGTYTGTDERNLQHFAIKSQPDFLKFIKIEMLSHYGSEHYCPLSVVRAFGTSLVEEFDAMENGGNNKNTAYEDDLDKLELGLIEDPIDTNRPSQNLWFGSAREAVINMVRRATAVLSKGSSDETINDAVIAKQFIIHQRALKLLPRAEPLLRRFDCIKFSRNFSMSNFTEVSRPCLYMESILGLPLYQVLCDEVLREPLLRFKCELNQTQVVTASSSVFQVPPSPQPLDPQTTSQNLVTNDVSSSSTTPAAAPVEELKVQPEKKATADTTTEKPMLDSKASDVISPTVSLIESAINVVTNMPNPFERLVIPTRVGKTTDTSAPVMMQAVQEIDGGSNITNDEKSGATNGCASSASATQEINQNLEIATASPPPPTTEASNSHPATPSPLPATPASTGSNGGAVLAASSSKESIFIKLNNRIKALEQNMSNTLQKIDELNASHSEEMAQLKLLMVTQETEFNSTLTALIEADQVKQHKFNDLTEKLQNISEIVQLFVVEKETLHWQFVQMHIILMAIETTIIVAVALLCVKKMKRLILSQKKSSYTIVDTSTSTSSFKRPNPGGINIFDGIRASHSPAKTKRLESTGEAIFIVQPSSFDFEVPVAKRKKRRRKPKGNDNSCSVALPFGDVKTTNGSAGPMVATMSSGRCPLQPLRASATKVPPDASSDFLTCNFKPLLPVF